MQLPDEVGQGTYSNCIENNNTQEHARLLRIRFPLISTYFSLKYVAYNFTIDLLNQLQEKCWKPQRRHVSERASKPIRSAEFGATANGMLWLVFLHSLSTSIPLREAAKGFGYVGLGEYKQA